MIFSEEDDYIYENSRGQIAVSADLAFVKIYPTLSPSIAINAVAREIRHRVQAQSQRKYLRQPSSGSLNNCSGRWNELSKRRLLIQAHFSIISETNNLYIIRMPNEATMKFWQVYNQESRYRFDQMMDILRDRGFSLRCSTPDFVVVSRRIVRHYIPQINRENLSLTDLQILTQFHQYIKGCCHPSDVKGFISIKNSNRPDRRYQILYEAAVTKYASQHIHPAISPLRFDVIGNSTPEDKKVFKAINIYSIPRTFPFSDRELQDLSRLIDSDESIFDQNDINRYWNRYL